VCAALLARKTRRRRIVIVIPMFLTFAVCVASPVNTYIRYMLPIMATLPAAALTLLVADGKIMEL